MKATYGHTIIGHDGTVTIVPALTSTLDALADVLRTMRDADRTAAAQLLRVHVYESLRTPSPGRYGRSVAIYMRAPGGTMITVSGPNHLGLVAH